MITKLFVFKPSYDSPPEFNDFLEREGFNLDEVYNKGACLIFDVNTRSIVMDEYTVYGEYVLSEYYSDFGYHDTNWGDMVRFRNICDKHRNDSNYKQQLAFILPVDYNDLMGEIKKIIHGKKKLFYLEKLNIIGL